MTDVQDRSLGDLVTGQLRRPPTFSNDTGSTTAAAVAEPSATRAPMPDSMPLS